MTPKVAALATMKNPHRHHHVVIARHNSTTDFCHGAAVVDFL